jgi:flagellar hook-basal body complex protein FliE
MSAVDPIGFIPPAQEIAVDLPVDSVGTGDFTAWMAKEIGATSTKAAQVDNLVQRLATGEVDNLHQVMIAMEDAKLSFQLFVQVRNKLLEAYQDILRMQV